MSTCFIIMGVSGCGKSSVAEHLHSKLNDSICLDADDFHPIANINKMNNGIPLTDTDRLPWLQALQQQINQQKSSYLVLACSALKKQYRQILIQDNPHVKFIYLDGDYDTISSRLTNRTNHFFDANLLQSQFDALEIPSHHEAFHISITHSVDEIIQTILAHFQINSASP